MDWKTYSLSLIDSLVWPAVLVVAIIVLRNPVANLIRTLKGFKAAGFGSAIDLEFDQAIEAALVKTEPAVKEELDDYSSISAPDLQEIFREHGSLSELVQDQPTAAIIRGDTVLERELNRLNVSEGEIGDVYKVDPYVLTLIRVLRLFRTLAHRDRGLQVRHAVNYSGYLLAVVLALRRINPNN